MTLLAALILAQTPASAATAADFFPLIPGSRRVYENKGDLTETTVEEVAAKPVYFDGAAAYGIVQKTQFNQVLMTTYYRVEGPLVSTVGYADDRTNSTTTLDRRGEANVLLPLVPTMPVFKYEGKPTDWSFAGVPEVKVPRGEQPRHGDETAIRGTARLGKPTEVLGRTVETLAVHVEVQLGTGKYAQTTVSDAVYGRGVGLVEATTKTTLSGKSRTTRVRLVRFEEKKEG